MKHKFENGTGRWIGLWGCSCGVAHYNCKTRKSAKESHARHVAEVKAREELAEALTRWQGEPRQLFLDVDNVADWAARDQDEVRQCGDSVEVEREARNNMKIINELARAFKALLVLDGWSAA